MRQPPRFFGTSNNTYKTNTKWNKTISGCYISILYIKNRVETNKKSNCDISGAGLSKWMPFAAKTFQMDFQATVNLLSSPVFHICVYANNSIEFYALINLCA